MRNHIGIPLLLVLSLLLGGISPVFDARVEASHTTSRASPPTFKNPKIKELREKLQKTPTFLEYTEYKMLKHKEIGATSSYAYDYDDYTLKPAGASPLSLERNGLGSLSAFQDSLFSNNVDLLTGGRAIDETLQLGSIGAAGGRTVDPRITEKRTIQSSLELYFNAKGVYPATLHDLIPKYAATSTVNRWSENFRYEKKGQSDYTLEPKIEAGIISVSQVTPLSLKPHPWKEMLDGRTFSAPDILSVVPKDDFLIYFGEAKKLAHLEEVVNLYGKLVKNIYGIGEALEIKKKVLARLGIEFSDELLNFVKDLAFVSYDFSFYPATDYALIFYIPEESRVDEFVKKFVTAGEGRHGRIGKYYAVASHPSFFEELRKAHEDPSLSMAKTPDLHYALAVLDPVYDGFVYISEAFVGKLTGPAYRLNAGRRNATAAALESLQYSVFAYRDITGNWPKSIEEMVSQGYLAVNKVYNADQYLIREDGIVSHKTWSSLYDLIPVGRVPIDTVTWSEKSFYDAFRDNYERYWRGFIDPVGITVTADQEIKLHTIILPLIEESQYNFVRDVFGGERFDLDFITKPDRIPAMQLLGQFDIDGLLFGLENSFRLFGGRPDPKVSRSEVIAKAKKDLAKSIKWEGDPATILDFVGNELLLAGGKDMKFELEDLSNLDFYLGLELKDTEAAKKFLDKVVESFTGGSRRRGSELLPFFAFPSKPLKNTYNGVEFYIIPTGFTNLYYTFLNNRFYAALSQRAINDLIDSSRNPISKLWASHIESVFQYLGKRNLLYTADVLQLKTWIKNLVETQLSKFFVTQQLKNHYIYYREALILGKTLDSYDGTAKNVTAYYRFVPERFYDGTLSSRESTPYLTLSGSEFNLGKIDYLSARYRYLDFEENGEEKATTTPDTVDIKEIIGKINKDKLTAEWDNMKGAGIGLAFVEDGLDIKSVFNNPLLSAPVAGAPAAPRLETPTKLLNLPMPYVVALGGGASFLLLGFASYLIIRRRRRVRGRDIAAEILSGGVARGLPREFKRAATPVSPLPAIPRELSDYISKSRSLGVSDGEIRRVLIENKWPEALVLEALSASLLEEEQ